MKNYRIGVIGVGVVGSAIKKGFEALGHVVKTYDTAHKNSYISDVLDTDIIFICVPTPKSKDKSCDISNVLWTVERLADKHYEGIVAVKSTVVPGTFKTLKKLFDPKRLALVPEFLREQHATSDFKENHNVLVIGTDNIEVFNLIKSCHGNYPKATNQVSPEEAEYVKYFSNAFKAYKTIFASSFGKLCKLNKVNYDKILKCYELENVSETAYLKYKTNEGFGGMCLPKDTAALAKFSKDTKGMEHIDTFDWLIKQNNKFNEN